MSSRISTLLSTGLPADRIVEESRAREGAPMLGADGMAVLAVEGEDAGDAALVHRSVLSAVAGIARRLGCRSAATLDELPAHFDADLLGRLRSELDQVVAFADAARRTGWSIGALAVVPDGEPISLLDHPEGRVWVNRACGFELRDGTGARPITELAGQRGAARRTPLIEIMAPLMGAVGRAGALKVYGRES